MHAKCSPSIYIYILCTFLYCGKAAVIIAVCTAEYGYNGILNAHFLSMVCMVSLYPILQFGTRGVPLVLSGSAASEFGMSVQEIVSTLQLLSDLRYRLMTA